MTFNKLLARGRLPFLRVVGVYNAIMNIVNLIPIRKLGQHQVAQTEEDQEDLEENLEEDQEVLQPKEMQQPGQGQG